MQFRAILEGRLRGLARHMHHIARQTGKISSTAGQAQATGLDQRLAEYGLRRDGRVRIPAACVNGLIAKGWK